MYNNGWDDENYDYVLEKEEVLLGRYVVKNRIGKGKCVRACAIACGIVWYIYMGRAGLVALSAPTRPNL